MLNALALNFVLECDSLITLDQPTSNFFAVSRDLAKGERFSERGRRVRRVLRSARRDYAATPLAFKRLADFASWTYFHAFALGTAAISMGMQRYTNAGEFASLPRLLWGPL